jgi:cell wall-associated NlpC family hydrolase
MVLSEELSHQIVASAKRFIDKPYDWDSFNCVHFVRQAYAEAGIVLPKLIRDGFPPDDFHLSEGEFASMPLGHSVFFKRIASQLPRIWTHIAIIVSSDALIHCSRREGKVVVTDKEKFLLNYRLSPKPFV